MPDHYLGIIVSGSKIDAVHLEIDSATVKLNNQFSWTLQSGDVPIAYEVIHGRVKDYIKNNSIKYVVIKASAVGKAKATLSHLKSAELRGVITTASVAGGASTKLVQKGTISRTFGDRNVDEYVKDDSFWSTIINGRLTKGKREAALLVLSQKGKI